MLTTLYIILFFSLGFCKTQSSVVYRVIPKNNDEIKQLSEKFNLKQFWIPPTMEGNICDLQVTQLDRDEAENWMKSKEIDYTLWINDVDALVTAEKDGMENSTEFGFDRYHTLKEIDNWMKNLPEKYANVEITKAGISFLGQNITSVEVTSPNKTRKTIVIEANIRGRDWISTAVATNIIDSLLSSSDPDIKWLAQLYNWYIIPVANPDGFRFTLDVDRFHHHTLEPYNCSSGVCYGSEANLNWDNHWDEVGTTKAPGSEFFPGSAPFSLSETKSLAEYVTSLNQKQEVVGYFALHSYGQELLIPYGWTAETLDNYNLTYYLGKAAVEAQANNFERDFKVRNVYNSTSPASGTSVDWVKAELQVPLVYQYQLPDIERFGFLIPPEEIAPISQETFVTFVTILREYEKVANNYM